MPPVTVGQFLVNDVLPEGHKISGPITNKGLHDHLVGLAKADPDQYVRTALALKRRGDEIATLEGISVGLDDIQPDYHARDLIVNEAKAALHAAKTPEAKERVILDAQAKTIALTKQHPGSMTHMALSGARGNAAQLMKIVSTPLASVHPRDGVLPHVFDKSYSEGLTPAQYWMNIPEIRANEVSARISVSEPGEMAKVLVANLISHAVHDTDCGTKNGVRMPLDSGHALDRYSQADQGLPRNTLVTPQVLQALKARGVATLVVRSPMTCAAAHGVCQHCQGLDEKGNLHRLGSTVGVRAAQAMAEPLTQMALSSRHGTLTVKGTTLAPTGLKGVRQLLEIPKAFKAEATLAPEAGVIQKIVSAPQGGHYLHLKGHELYAPPGLELLVREGSAVEAGDALTSGVPNPAKVVAAKGIGAGRAYFVDAMHRLYKNEGVDLDRRHLELLAKAEINHVRLLDADADHPHLLKGDTINYNAFRDAYARDVVEVPLDEALGRRLGAEVLHHTVGTTLTPSLLKDLGAQGVHHVLVAKKMPRLEFVMKPFAMNPLLGKDWMARMAHRRLKDVIQEAAHFGQESDTQGHPVPAYAYGATLKHGPGGSY